MTPEKRRELEIFLATEVMGWKPLPAGKTPFEMQVGEGEVFFFPYTHDAGLGIVGNSADDGHYMDAWKPLSDLNQSGELLEKASGWDMSSSNAGTYCAVTVEIMPTATLPEERELSGEADEESPALAICLAMAKAFGRPE